MLIWQLIMRFIELNRRNKILRRFTATCAAITVFITTYAMILPAISLERMVADETPGFVLEETVQPEDLQAEDVPAEGEGIQIEEPIRTVASRTFTAAVTGAAISVTFADAADFDENLELCVEEVSADIEEERYASYLNGTASALAVELPTPEGDATITAAKFYQIHFERDHETVIPTGSAIVLVQAQDVPSMDEDEVSIATGAAIGVVTFEGMNASLHLSEDVRVSDAETQIEMHALTADVIGVFEAPQYAGGVLAYQGTDFTVEATYPAFSGVSGREALNVDEIDEANSRYQAYREKLDETFSGQKILGSRFFDITILGEDGSEIQPLRPVAVSIHLAEPLTEAVTENEDRKIDVVHFEENKPETVEEIELPVRMAAKKAMSAPAVAAMKDGTILTEREPSITAATLMEDVHVYDNGIGGGQAIRYTADHFSVYAIIDHEGGMLITPRVVFHYINYDFTEYANGVFAAGPYNFEDKSVTTDDYLWTQILKDGEVLDEVPTPPVYNNTYFNGWYMVNLESDTTSFDTNSRRYIGTVRYTVPNDPTREIFGQTISISQGAEDANGIPINWTMNGSSYRGYADAEGRVHVYLAPLYANFNYVNFYDFDGNLIARKMLVLDSNGFASMLVSDLEATSPVNVNNYFMGWSTVPYNPGNDQQTAANTLSLYEDGYKKTVYITLYRASEGADIAVYEGVYSDASALAGHEPSFTVNTDASGGNVNLYAEYEIAHWLRFIAGETGWGSMYVPADYLVGDAAATHLPTTTRAGYVFAGWYSGYQDTDGHIHYYEQVTDNQGVVLTGAEKHLVEKASGTGGVAITTYDQYGNPEEGTVNVSYTGSVDTSGKLSMTKDSYLYAMWTANTTAKYKVIIWQQRVTDDKDAQYLTPVEYNNWLDDHPDATAEEIAVMRAAVKKYDFYNSYLEEAEALSVITLPGNSSYLNYSFDGFHLAEDYNTATYGTASHEVNVVIDPQNTSVINVYYDRDRITFTFRDESTSKHYVYVPTDNPSATPTHYGYVDGDFTALTYNYNTGLWSGPEYIWDYRLSSDGNYGKVGDRFYELTPVYETVTTYTANYRYVSSTNNSANYGLDSDGRYVELERRGWIITNWYYEGTNTQYTGTRYIRYNDSTDVTDNVSLNIAESYYIDSNGGKVPVTANVNEVITGYTYIDDNGIEQEYEGTDRYNYTYAATGNVIPWTNTMYVYTNSYPITMTGLYMQPLSQYGYVWPQDYSWLLASGYLQPVRYEFSGSFTATYNRNYSNPEIMQFFLQRVDGSEPDYNGIPDASRKYATNTGTEPGVFEHQFSGFTPSKYRVGTNSNWIMITSDNYNNQFRVTDTTQMYFTRNNYTLTFSTNYPGDAQFTSGALASENHIEPNVPYEASLTPYGNAAPTFTAPDHYIFDGWYEDQSCTVPFDFSQMMPAANKVIYAKWYPVYYLIQIDPTGGTLAGTTSQNESTYFWLQYGTTIGQYATSRDYLETTAEEAAGLGAETYYYRYVSPTINANGTVLEHSAWSGSNVATLWGSDLDSEKDNEGIRPSFYRMAEYVKVSDYHTLNDPFYQYMVANGSQELADAWDANYVDTTKLYREVSEGDPTWTFVGWYKDGMPYDFTSAVTSDVTLKAVWRQSGDYFIYYDPRMQIEGVVGTLTADAYDPTNPSQSNEGYIDKAATHVKTAPTEIHGINQETSGNTYIFEGWRVVGPNGNPLDENGNIMSEETFLANAEQYLYQPGDEFIIRSEQAHIENGHNIIELRAYYRKVEDSSRYPDVVQLILDANTAYSGYLDPDATTWPVWADPGHSAVDTKKTANIGGATQFYQIAFGDAQENQAIHLTNYRPFFTNNEGHFLLGFDPQPDPEQCENGAYIPKYAADAIIGIDDPAAVNMLYAIWEPMVYVSFVNYTGAPVTISLNSLAGETSIEATVINNATQTYERTAITNMNSVTVASGQTIRLVIPKGAEKDLNLSLANNHIGFKMSAKKQVGDNPAADLFGGELETPEPLEYSQSYTDTQQLITSFTGIVYTLTEEPLDYAYFDVNRGTWTDQSHTAANQAAATADRPFWRVTEAGAYLNDYQIAVENFRRPTDPTPPSGTQFLGWTTDEYVAQIRDFSLTIGQMTERRDAAAPGSSDYLLYDHLINLIEEYKAAYGITEVTNLLQVVEAYSLWNFSNPPAGTVYYAVYAELATVNYHLMYQHGTNGSNHTWGLSVSGNTSTGQLGTVYTRSTPTDVDEKTHVVWTRQVVKGRSIIKPVAPTYGGSEKYSFLYWLKDDSTHTAGTTTPSAVTPFSFVEPITGNLDLYTSWNGGYNTKLNVKKFAMGAQSNESDAFNFRYFINTYMYTYTGGATTRTLYHSDSTGISLAAGENRDINLYYWTDANGNLYAQSVQISETGLASSGYELTITDSEGRSSTAPTSTNTTGSLIFADNSTGENFYRFYPVSNHAVEEGSDNYYMKGVSEKEQMTVWHFTKEPYDLYFWNNNWYKDLQCMDPAPAGEIPDDTHEVTFTNEKDARIRFIKVDENGYDRLNGARFTLTKLDASDEPMSDKLSFVTGYARTKDETSGRNGRFLLVMDEATSAAQNNLQIRMDTDRNEVVFREAGTYRLTETAAPSGYYLPSELNASDLNYVDITVTANGITLAGNASVASEVALSQLNIGEFDNDNEYAVVIQNTQKQVSFQIQKVDTTGTPLTNGAASFTVTGAASASGNYVNLGTVQTDPDNEGKTVVQTVPYGTYTATETVAPTGYRLADDTVIEAGDTFTASGHNVYGAVTGIGTPDDPYIVRIQDEQTGFNLTIREIDVHAPTNPAPTYTVTVQAATTTGETSPAGKTYNVVAIDADNNSSNSAITFDAEGKATISISHGKSITLRSLPAGDYIVTEATGGYSTHVNVVQPSSSHTLVNANANTATFALSTATIATFTNTYGVPVKIVLTGSSNPAKPLAGATFSLAGGDINETSLTSTLRTVTSSTGSVTEALIYETSVLPAGEYTLTQTGMVDGYIPLEGPVTIEVTSSESGLRVSAILSGSGRPFSVIKDTNTGVWTITIMNQTGYALPSTGGKGTMSYFVFAGLCFVLAGVLMILRRRNRTASCIS